MLKYLYATIALISFAAFMKFNRSIETLGSFLAGVFFVIGIVLLLDAILNKEVYDED